MPVNVNVDSIMWILVCYIDVNTLYKLNKYNFNIRWEHLNHLQIGLNIIVVIVYFCSNEITLKQTIY